MFRSVLSDSLKKAFALKNLKSNYCSKPRTFPEVNQVTLVGTLISDAFTLQSGTKSLTLKTCNATNEKYQIFHVHTKIFDGVKAGQRVYVTGKLKSNKIEIEDGKKRDQIAVHAQRIFVLKNGNENQNTAADDINQVSVVANVVNVNKSNDKAHILTLATHFNRPSENGTESTSQFLSVFVFDEHLRRLTENLKASDKVAVNGELRSSTNTMADGKKKYSGFIAANSIQQVQRRAEQADHGDVEHEANN